MIIFAGDIHGDIRSLARLDEKAHNLGATALVLCGDVGVFWPTVHIIMHRPSGLWDSPFPRKHIDDSWSRFKKFFEKRTRQGKRTHPIFFCDGNHENHDALDQVWEDQGRPDVVEILPGFFHVRRGSVISLDDKKLLFMGGAVSIDKSQRTEGVSWWAREVPNKIEWDRFFENWENEKPDIIVSHDCPLGEMRPWRHGSDFDEVARTFEKVWNMTKHSPSGWFFGHHHVLKVTQLGKTKFVCCGSEGEHFPVVLPKNPKKE